MGFIIEIVAHLTGIVVKEEIDGFADFGDGVAEGFTGLRTRMPISVCIRSFHQHRCAFMIAARSCGGWQNQIGGSIDWRWSAPAFNLFRAGFTHAADDIFGSAG